MVYQNAKGMYTQQFLTEVLERGTQNLTPFVGMHVTVSTITGRKAATITYVSKSGKRIVVQDNKVKCHCYYTGRYDVLPDLEGMPYALTLRKNGRWVMTGEPQNGPGISFGIHWHCEY